MHVYVYINIYNIKINIYSSGTVLMHAHCVIHVHVIIEDILEIIYYFVKLSSLMYILMCEKHILCQTVFVMECSTV